MCVYGGGGGGGAARLSPEVLQAVAVKGLTD